MAAAIGRDLVFTMFWRGGFKVLQEGSLDLIHNAEPNIRKGLIQNPP